MEKIMRKNIYIPILAAGILWGTQGAFGKLLMSSGLTSIEVAFSRLFFGSMILILYIVMTDRKELKISYKGLGYACVVGFFSKAIFNLFYYTAIDRLGVAVAAVLLYMAPIFLAVMSRLIFKERIDWLKKLSLILCFGGCFLAVTGGNIELKILDLSGIGFGIGAAVSYALLSVICKKAMTGISTLSLTVYSFTFGWIFLLPVAKPWTILTEVTNVRTLLMLLGLGLFTSVLPYVLYLKGIARGVDLSVAGVISSTELLVSVLLAWILLGEIFSLARILGVGIIIISIVIIGGLSNTKQGWKRSLQEIDS